MTPEEKLPAIRAAIPSLAAGIQLNTGTSGPMPSEVLAAMAELTDYERAYGRGQFDYYLEALDRRNEARAGIAAILGADIGSISLTRSTTEGMNIATWGLDWAPGDVAVTSTHEHIGGLGPLYGLRDRRGVELRFADVGVGGDDEATLAAFDRAITPGTKLVSVSHVLWSTGAVLPVARIADLAHDRGAVVVIDGAQAVGAIPVDVQSIGADAYAHPAQKWLLGPEGMGGLWVSPAAADRIQPLYGGYFGFERYDSSGTAVRHPDGRRFETSDFHRPSIPGFARALSWLSMYVGLDFVLGRGPATARRAADALAAIDGVEVITPRDRMATLIVFRIDGWECEAALDELGARTFAIARTIPHLDALRISVGFFTSDEEVDRFVEGVRLLAAHTPATLPPRRTLPILEAS